MPVGPTLPTRLAVQHRGDGTGRQSVVGCRGDARRTGGLGVAGMLAGGVAAAGVVLVVMLVRFEVGGPSMRPTLEPGDRLLALRLPRRWPLRAGALVVLHAPVGTEVVKRVASVAGDRVEVLGDNPVQSTDSRTYGPVDRRMVTARVLYRYSPPPRTGRVR